MPTSFETSIAESASDVYANFHFTKYYGKHPEASKVVPVDLLQALNRIHSSNEAGVELTDDERREVFTTHFLSEQQHIVGPTIEKAIAEFDWSLLRSLALRPVIRFAYFRRPFLFRNFANKEERIAKGLVAFNVAAETGWNNVEQDLRKYDVLPEQFFAKPNRILRVPPRNNSDCSDKQCKPEFLVLFYSVGQSVTWLAALWSRLSIARPRWLAEGLTATVKQCNEVSAVVATDQDGGGARPKNPYANG